MKQISDHEGLEDVELKLAGHASHCGGNMVTHYLGSYHCQGLALRGVDLARHDRGAGLVLREDEFAETTSWTRAEISDVLGNLEEGACNSIQCSGCFDDRVVRCENLKLVWCGNELRACHFGDFLGDSLGEALECVETSANCCATLRKLS